MARVKLSEYRAKKLILGDLYQGVPVTDTVPKFAKGNYAVKVDQGVKKRYKQGLLFLNQSAAEVPKAVAALRKKGYTRFLVEPMTPHEATDEHYLSLERVRDGIRILRSRQGGVDIEAHPESIETTIIYDSATVTDPFLKRLIEVFDREHFSFLEVNPLVGAVPLDAAAMVDSAAAFFVKGWTEDDLVEGRAAHPAEARVAALQKTTPASLKLTVLNPDGSLWFLLSGGGGSIVVVDEAALQGYGATIGNYGEYSGGPSREETYLYAKEVIGCMLASKAERKALIIAGGVANFTDIRATLAGVVDALAESAEALRKAGVKVYVRRGGPHEAEGLTHLQEFLTSGGLLGSVHGSEAIITAAVTDALATLPRTP